MPPQDKQPPEKPNNKLPPVTRPARYVSRLTQSTLALVLAGGRGSRLEDLTRWRAKPAVPFGGRYRIIDFALSNCINSGIRRIGVLTQYKSHSLIRHLQRGWGFLRGEFNEFVEILPAQQRTSDEWYRGTADAVYQNLDIIRLHAPEYVLILAGDHIYKMDYGAMLARHVQAQADLSIGCVEIAKRDASSFGVMQVDEQRRIRGFEEKPKRPKTIPDKNDRCLASMGIYIFNAKFLIEQLIKDTDTKGSSHDFGKDIIPTAVPRYRVFAYPFTNEETGAPEYWRDVGSVDAFWEANVELMATNPELDLYDNHWPIWTYQEQSPPAKLVSVGDQPAHAQDSMLSGGCVLRGATINRSLLFSNVRIAAKTVVEDSVLLPDVKVGANCRIHRAVIDKGCQIQDDTHIGIDAQADAARYFVSPKGITLVTPHMLGQEVHHAR